MFLFFSRTEESMLSKGLVSFLLIKFSMLECLFFPVKVMVKI